MAPYSFAQYKNSSKSIQKRLEFPPEPLNIYHLSNPKSFLPNEDNSAVLYFVCSHFLGSPGKAYPSGAFLSLQDEIRHWRSSSLPSSAGIMEIYCAMRTLLPLVFGLIP